MPSYQDIETRLVTCENKLNFMMNSMRMKAFIANGLVNPDGTPAGKHVDGTMLDFYYLAQQPGVGSKMIDESLLNEAEKVATDGPVIE